MLNTYDHDAESSDARTYRTEDELITTIKGKTLESLTTDLGPELAQRLLTANEALGLDTFSTFYWFYLRPNIPRLNGKTMYETYRDGDKDHFLSALRLFEAISKPHEP
jgi:hypothetical protein